MIPVKVKLMKLVFMVGEDFGWIVDSTAILPCLWYGFLIGSLLMLPETLIPSEALSLHCSPNLIPGV